MKAKSIKGKSTEEIQSALDQSLADGFTPTVAVVFIPIKQDRKAVCEILHNEGIDIIGATSCGVFMNGYQDGFNGVGTAVIMLMNLNRDYYTILYENFEDRNVGEAASQIAKSALQKFKEPAFIICSTGLSAESGLVDGGDLMSSMEKVVGQNVNIYGGMAGDDLTYTGTYAFTYERESEKGIAALVLDEDKISLFGMAISGWNPLGILRTVTKNEGGWIYTIDDQPALQMYLKYLGNKPISGEKEYELFEDVGFHYPFQVEGIGDPVMRTPFKFNKDENALMCDYDVPQGSKLRFSMPPDYDIVENVLEKAKELKSTSKTDADALLIFSCAGRLSSLGPLTNSENDGLSEIWNAPMAGFFTYGEYGTNLTGRQEFHSTTCCWVALKEK
jgi:hypothetical protein